ncbi:Aux/IAA-ARF-dimerization [Cynara cardunculus var. scolymus]|uniref:Auxin-responsive protein n=1 Tax=Cynara cardunculus var. scolymus TaxID=59895 RepID=A0A118K4C6_CYNCS|nr:Aux/IAA-ARF-dimerization [Cynara cardunculus var. scolymus]
MMDQCTFGSGKRCFPDNGFWNEAEQTSKSRLRINIKHHLFVLYPVSAGQPKRHLLTTGWSMLVGAKRLKAGDAVIFIRRANRQQTASPSSILSADSMHIGVLAAAAHAAANQSPFSIFYNPRYMGTITGISDVDPLRWPDSNLFIFPSLTSNLKRPFGHGYVGDQTEWGNMVTRPFMRAPEAINSLWSEQLIKMSRKPQTVNGMGSVSPVIQEACAANRAPLQEAKASILASSETVKSESSQLTSSDDDKLSVKPAMNPPNLINEQPIVNQLSPLDSSLLNDQQFVSPELDPSLSGLFPYSSIGEETWDPRDDIYGCLNFECSNGGSTVVDPSVSSTGLDGFCAPKAGAFQNPSEFIVNNNLCSSQDVQSQFTSSSLVDSQAYTVQELPDNSGGTSSSNGEFNGTGLVQNSSWHQIQKAGSVGRSIDVSSFKNYDELCCAIERMFGLEGLLNDSVGSGWKLVYVDFENDVLLVGDDPWEEFVGCVRCIRILSPCEVRQMGEEGMQLLNNSTAALQALMTVRHQTPETA